jgi:hypothetical protein
VKGWEDAGLSHTAGKWLTFGGRLYAVSMLHENIGFTDFDRRLPPSPVRDAAHPSRARKGFSPLAREAGAGGDFGPIFPLFDNLPDALPFEVTTGAEAAAELGRMFLSPAHLTHWDFEGRCGLPAAWDGHRLCEPTTFRDAAGRWVMLLRDTVYSHRMYRSEWDEASGAWRPGEPTDVPDSPSLSVAAMLADGTVLLVGNQCAPRFDNWDEVTHHVRSPLTVSVSEDGRVFSRVYALRFGPHEWNVPRTQVGGRGPGYQYPDAVVRDGRLWVLYSIGKERIAISSVGLSELGVG